MCTTAGNCCCHDSFFVCLCNYSPAFVLDASFMMQYASHLRKRVRREAKIRLRGVAKKQIFVTNNKYQINNTVMGNLMRHGVFRDVAV